MASQNTTLRPVNRLRARELDHYPEARVRYTSLAIVILATIVLYYQLYLSGGVAVEIIASYGLSFRWFVILNVVALAIAAVAAHFGGFTDRFGRANVTTVGLFVVGLLSAVAVPLCNGRWSFAVVFCVLNAAEGVILVATPALVRDFSPQLGRASAMGFWTMGPELGSLVVTSVVGGGTTDWQKHYVIAGICGLVVAVLSIPLLKELAPGLRDQVMVEKSDLTLIETRVQGIDGQAGPSNGARQMFRPDIIMSSVAISLFLLFYVSMVAIGPTYLEVTFGYSQSKANNVLVWAWAANAVGLVLAGWISDKLLVRKPLMLVGAVVTVAMIVVFIGRAPHTETAYSTLATIFAVMFFFTGVTYVAWMAAFTETVERRNPALTATGLAVWGLIIRGVFALFIFTAPYLVDTVNTIVDNGPTVSAIAEGKSPQLTAAQNAAVAAVAEDPTIVGKLTSLAAQYADQLTTSVAIDDATEATLAASPGDATAGAKAAEEIATALNVTPPVAVTRLAALGQVPKADLAFLQQYGPPLRDPTVAAKLTYLQTHGPAVRKALKDGPAQWQKYFWISAGGAALFIPLIWLMAGFWTPARARAALREHESAVARELAKVRS